MMDSHCLAHIAGEPRTKDGRMTTSHEGSYWFHYCSLAKGHTGLHFDEDCRFYFASRDEVKQRSKEEAAS